MHTHAYGTQVSQLRPSGSNIKPSMRHSPNQHPTAYPNPNKTSHAFLAFRISLYHGLPFLKTLWTTRVYYVSLAHFLPLYLSLDMGNSDLDPQCQAKAAKVEERKMK